MAVQQKKYHTTYETEFGTHSPDNAKFTDEEDAKNVWETLTNRGNAIGKPEGLSVFVPYHAVGYVTLTTEITEADKHDPYCWKPEGGSECDSLVGSAVVDCSKVQ